YLALFSEARAQYWARREEEFAGDVAAIRAFLKRAEEEAQVYEYDQVERGRERVVRDLDEAEASEEIMEAVAAAARAETEKEAREVRLSYLSELKAKWASSLRPVTLEKPSDGSPPPANFFKRASAVADADVDSRTGRRRVTPDDVAPPRNLSRAAARKIDQAELRYTNLPLLREHVSDAGTILPRRITGVSAKDQRKIQRMVKQARNMGLIPHVGGWEVRSA
ncbi:hypothetical protein TeGR_g11035, partial [Tetraparma gracilis]